MAFIEANKDDVVDGRRARSRAHTGRYAAFLFSGLNEPNLVTGDGALGAWAALRDVFPGAGGQQCWAHMIANVLDALPKRLQAPAKTPLHEMVEAPTGRDARQTLETFRAEFAAKYPKAVDKLDRDWRYLTASYAFPAEDWRHLRTTNPIESSFRDGQAAHARHQGRRQQGRGIGHGASCSRPPRVAGGASTVTSSSPTCSRAQRSETGIRVLDEHPTHDKKVAA